MLMFPGLPFAPSPIRIFAPPYSKSPMLSLKPRDARWMRLDFRFIMNEPSLFSVAEKK